MVSHVEDLSTECCGSSLNEVFVAYFSKGGGGGGFGGLLP